MVPWKDANIHVLNHTLHYGMGVFEGVRAYQTPEGTAIFRLQAHTARFLHSIHIMGLSIPFDAPILEAAQKETVAINELTECYIRPICFLGSESLGLRVRDLSVHVAIGAWEWSQYMPDVVLERGITACTSSYSRPDTRHTMCKAKTCGNYVNSLLALKEATERGFDEALLLDTEGYASEGSGDNLFIITDGELHTPEKTTCLPGITRDSIIELARDEGMTVVERRITRDEIYTADEAFFTGTAVEILPMRELDGRRIGNGCRGPLTENLQTLYLKQVRGQHDGHPEWLTLVDDA